LQAVEASEEVAVQDADIAQHSTGSSARCAEPALLIVAKYG
jgi:hypothetical protein